MTRSVPEEVRCIDREEIVVVVVDHSTLDTARIRAMRIPELMPPVAVQPLRVWTPTIWPALLRMPEPELPPSVSTLP